LHLIGHGVSSVSLNAAITGLKFFFEITLHESDLMAWMRPARVPRMVSVVPGVGDVRRLITAVGNLEH
jgi:integrase/recombinase XerD